MDIEEKRSEIENQLDRHPNGIRVVNKTTKHSVIIRSIYEIPNGYEIGKIVSDETRKKMSDSAKKRGVPPCAYRDKKGTSNPMYNRHLVYINNGIVVRRVDKGELSTYLYSGWILGRKIR